MLPSANTTVTAPLSKFQPPLVSILFITYNHAAYIRQALDGILMQQVPFELEIVVANDASTDETTAIIAEYVARMPHLYQVLAYDVNLGVNRNVDRGLGACRGRYVALIEGDDYWTDRKKLAAKSNLWKQILTSVSAFTTRWWCTRMAQAKAPTL